MSPLETVIRAEIARDGPISVARYMTLALQHPRHGYYITRDPLGAAGDFTTAPEISQMFGEMIAVWIQQVAVEGGLDDFTLLEAGPGRGSLMADCMRVLSRLRDPAPRPVLIETSPALRAVQAETLAQYGPVWHDRLADAAMDAGPLLVIANEFVDALPLRQFVRDGALWRERMIGIDGDRLAFGLSPAAPFAELDALFGEVADGTLVEHRAGIDMLSDVAGHIAHHGGAMLLIDYGDWDGTGDTFQALSSHGVVDPLHAPGEADLTSHVNFSHLARQSRPLVPWFTAQGAFLERLGMTERATALARLPSGGASIAAQHRRLTHPEEMGVLFKVLALTPDRMTRPAGFDEADRK